MIILPCKLCGKQPKIGHYSCIQEPLGFAYIFLKCKCGNTADGVYTPHWPDIKREIDQIIEIWNKENKRK